MTETTTETKIAALAAHTGADIEDIEQATYDDLEFEADGETYLVCTDEEADRRTGEYIKDSLWAFNASFIIDNSKLPPEAEEMIKTFCGEKCKSANETIAALIDDIDEFIDAAICADGRGHFIGFYDGEEIEEGDLFIYRT